MNILSLLFCIIFFGKNYESLAKTPENTVQQCYGFCDLMLNHNNTYEEDWNATETRIKTLQDQIAEIETELEKSKPNTNRFSKIGTRYFRIVDYHYTNWFSASESCRELGGQLAVIQNEEELNAINAQLDENSAYWLDINDLAYEGQYVSWTSGKRPSYLKWFYDRPGTNSDIEDCVLLSKKAMWDQICTRNAYYICQSDVVEW